jgi:GDP-D-mannose dehydratase
MSDKVALITGITGALLTEVDDLIGDASKAKDLLGWQARTYPPELAKIVVDADRERLGA